MKHHVHRACLYLFALSLACTGNRLYYLHSELPKLEGDPDLAVAPGPWKNEEVPVVLSNATSVPDDLLLAALKALMALPGAADACDADKRPRPDATEYCIAFYRTPLDWRVSWPIRSLTGELNMCQPPFGGVEDEEFGRNLPIFGFAHNHPCGTPMSSPDLDVFPWTKAGEGEWVVVAYAATPSGRLARDARGQLIAVWHWLATGRRDAPRFYKWNPAGEVFRWSEDKKHWEFQATCRSQSSNMLGAGVALPADCSPSLER